MTLAFLSLLLKFTLQSQNPQFLMSQIHLKEYFLVLNLYELYFPYKVLAFLIQYLLEILLLKVLIILHLIFLKYFLNLHFCKALKSNKYYECYDTYLIITLCKDLLAFTLIKAHLIVNAKMCSIKILKSLLLLPLDYYGAYLLHNILFQMIQCLKEI